MIYSLGRFISGICEGNGQHIFQTEEIEEEFTGSQKARSSPSLVRREKMEISYATN